MVNKSVTDIRLFGEKGKFTVFEKGIHTAYMKEPSIRFIMFLLSIGVPISFYYEQDLTRRFMLLIASIAIFNSEIINTAIEATIDRISLKHHILSGYAKDLASSATIIWFIFGIYVWGEWFYHQWNESKESRKEGQRNIFYNWKHSLMFVVFWGVIFLPVIWLFHIIFKLSN